MSKKKKPPKEPDYSKMPVLPNKLAEFVQEQRGITTDVLLKLLESVQALNEDTEVAQIRKIAGKKYSTLIGGRKAFGSTADAIEHTKERVEQRHEKEEKILELLEDVDVDDLMLRNSVRDSLYPQPLAPTDIAEYVDSAIEKLEKRDRERASIPKQAYSPRDETMLDVITLVKKLAPIRLARRFSEWQKAYIAIKTPEQLEAEHKEWLRLLRGEPTEEDRLAMEEAERLATEEAAAEADRIAAEEAARNLNDLADLHTLLDDVADLIKNNPEAAAAIVRLWVGNPTAAMEAK